MPIPENAEQVCIPCRPCVREHFVLVDSATRQALAYHGSGTPVLSGESLPVAFNRLLNAPCDECQRIKDLERDFIARRLADLGEAAYTDPEHAADPDLPPSD